MNPKNNQAANFATKMAATHSSEYGNLSALMCWDAIKYCALKSGIISQAKYNVLNAENDLVSASDQAVVGANSLRRLERGNVLGFFWNGKIIHAMIYLGQGLAAGNKNNCVGVGHFIGWEILDLENLLGWAEDGTVIAPSPVGKSRIITICRRPLSYLEFK